MTWMLWQRQLKTIPNLYLLPIQTIRRGTWFEEAEFEAFMQKVPANVIVVLDEAYVEYFPENFNSLKFFRTISKHYCQPYLV